MPDRRGTVPGLAAGAVIALATALALSGCLPVESAPGSGGTPGPGTTPAAPVPQNRAPTAVGEAHESEVPAGWDEPGDAPVVPVEDLGGADLVGLLRVQASSDPVDRACTGGQLGASLRFTDAALGHRYGLITVSNEGAEPCALRGYPGLGARGAWGNPFVIEVEQTPLDPSGQYLPDGVEHVPETVVLGAGETTQVLLEWTGALGGAASEPLGDLVLQPFRGADPVIVHGAADEASDLSMFTTVRVGPFLD